MRKGLLCYSSKNRMKRTIAILALAAPFLSAQVPTPESVLGHKPGDDFYLANYNESKDYFHKLDNGNYLLGRDGDKLFHNWLYRLEVFFREWDRSITALVSIIAGGGLVSLILFLIHIWNIIKSLKH